VCPVSPPRVKPSRRGGRRRSGAGSSSKRCGGRRRSGAGVVAEAARRSPTVVPMPFPANVLNPGEEVVLDVRPHWWYLTAPVAILVVVIVGSLVAVIESAPSWAVWTAVAALALAATFLLHRYARWTSTRLVVTTSRLIRRTGVVSRSGREIPLSSLTDISYRQNLWDRIIGAGDVLLESAGRDSQEVFPDLPRPAQIQQVIAVQVDQVRRQQLAGPPVRGAAEPSIPDQIEQLDGLRQRGVLTDAEFDAKKAELLKRL